MADSLKVNSWDHAIGEEGFIEIYQEPTHFILILLVSLFQLFYQSCWNTIKWLMFNPLLVPLSGRNIVSGKRPESWMVGKGKWYVFISWIKCPWPDKVQQGHPWDWAFGAPFINAWKVMDPSGRLPGFQGRGEREDCPDTTGKDP